MSIKKKQIHICCLPHLFCVYVLGGIIYWIPYVSPEVKVMDFWPRPQLPFAKENPKEYFQNFIKLEKDIKPIYLKMGVNSL